MPRPSAGLPGEEGAMAANLTPVETRAQDALFVAQCSLEGLRQRLPLPWPTPPHIPSSPKKSYRSQYVYLGWEDLEDPAAWSQLSDFDLLLRLVDFDGLRPVLAHLLGWHSARGHVPFDPVSLFLFIGWQLDHHWSRAEALRNLASPRYADYAQRFGFREGVFPTEGGIRYFLTTLGRQSDAHGQAVTVDAVRSIAIAMQRLNQLLAQSVALLREAGVISPQAWAHAIICPDGMLHEAASRMRCASATDTCYQPTTPAAPRPCPARAKGRQGCDCATLACATACRYATPRDPEARFVWYAGSNQPTTNPNQPADDTPSPPKRGKGVYGYRSLPVQWVDPLRRFSLILLDDFRPANQPETDPMAALLLQLPVFYPDLHVEAVVGDAGLGYDQILDLVYHHLHARRVIDLRRHDTDQDQTLWPLRGYDDTGRPICPFGYAFISNGYDDDRQRHKWFCNQACRKGVPPAVTLPDVIYPPPDCPYQGPDHPHGRIINIADRFPDGSIRLVRDIPYQSPAWKRLYHQARNAVEGRNAAFQGRGLKRLPVYGLPRGKAVDFLNDVWLNLSTLARLVREATAATGC